MSTDKESMKPQYVKLFLISAFLATNASCAKFDLFVNDNSSTDPGGPTNPGGGGTPPGPGGPTGSALNLTFPGTDFRFIRNENVTATGTCDPEGGQVSLSGDSIVGTASGACDTSGEFNIPITARNTGVGLELIANQTDNTGDPLTDSSTNLSVHCVDTRASELTTCTVSGSGTSLADPYIVPDIQCLQEMRDGLTCHYALEDDIDAGDTHRIEWGDGSGLGFEPVPFRTDDSDHGPKFRGTLNGRGHTISNLKINQRNIYGTGLFSVIADDEGITRFDQVRNITFNNAQVRGNTLIGIVAAFSKFSDFDNVNIVDSHLHIDNTQAVSNFTVSNAGLMLGMAKGSWVGSTTVRNSRITIYAYPDTTINTLGGLIGLSDGGQVHDSSIHNHITSAWDDNGEYQRIGGVYGATHAYPSIRRSDIRTTISLTSNQTATNTTFENIGGISGINQEGMGLEDICNNASITLNSRTRVVNVGGSTGSGVGEAYERVSNKGSLNVSTTGSQLEQIGGLVGHARNMWFASYMASSNNINLQSANGSNPLPINNAGGLVGFYDTESFGYTTTFYRVGIFGSFNSSIGSTGNLGAFLGSLGSGNFSPNYVWYVNDTSTPSKGVVGDGSTYPNVKGRSLSQLQNMVDADYEWGDLTGSAELYRKTRPSLPEVNFCVE